jgi:hypothetical protein
VIDAYLRELEPLLHRGHRQRILAEVRDHLLESAQRSGERAAVAAFGAPRLVAVRFAQELALGTSRRATAATIVAGVVGAILLAVAAAPDAPGFFAAQVAATCGALNVMRLLRHRRDRALAAGTLRHIDHANAVAVAALAVAGAESAAPAAALAAAAVAGWLALRSHAHTRALAALHDEPAGAIALDDLVALTAGSPLATPARWARTHPWRLCLAVATAAGAGAAAAHAIGEGAGSLGQSLAASTVLMAIEGGAVVACYAALGRWIGLR